MFLAGISYCGFNPIDLSLLFGFLLLVGSIGCIALAARELFKNETTIIPDGQPEKLVTTGPFSFSRNPIYLGMAGILISSVGIFYTLLKQIGIGKLPGDLILKGENYTFYFPIVSCIIISLVLTTIFNLFRNKWKN